MRKCGTNELRLQLVCLVSGVKLSYLSLPVDQTASVFRVLERVVYPGPDSSKHGPQSPFKLISVYISVLDCSTVTQVRLKRQVPAQFVGKGNETMLKQGSRSLLKVLSLETIVPAQHRLISQRHSRCETRKSGDGCVMFDV